MSIINFTFDYEAPDCKGSAIRELGKTGTWRYEGPEEFYCAVGVDGTLSAKPPIDASTSPGFVYNPNFLTVKVRAKDNPVVASLLYPNMEIQENTSINWECPTGDIVTINDPVNLLDAYTHETISYNSDVNRWILTHFDMGRTWDDVRAERDKALEYWDAKTREDMPEDLYNSVLALKEQLRNLPALWADYQPCQVVLPELKTPEPWL